MLALIEHHAAALAAREAHAEGYAAAEDRYAAATPPIPDAPLLHQSGGFGVVVDKQMGSTGDGRGWRDLWFDGNATDVLREMTPPSGLVERHAEIVAAFDRWDDEVDVVYESTGMKVADAEDDRLFDPLLSAERAVLDVVPTTLQGFQAKARWVMTLTAWQKEHAAMVVRDLCAMDMRLIEGATRG